MLAFTLFLSMCMYSLITKEIAKGNENAVEWGTIDGIFVWNS